MHKDSDEFRALLTRNSYRPDRMIRVASAVGFDAAIFTHGGPESDPRLEGFGEPLVFPDAEGLGIALPPDGMEVRRRGYGEGVRGGREEMWGRGSCAMGLYQLTRIATLCLSTMRVSMCYCSLSLSLLLHSFW